MGYVSCTAASRGKTCKRSLASVAEDEDLGQVVGDALELPEDDDNVSAVRTYNQTVVH